jgi:hypothetical protein
MVMVIKEQSMRHTQWARALIIIIKASDPS